MALPRLKEIEELYSQPAERPKLQQSPSTVAGFIADTQNIRFSAMSQIRRVERLIVVLGREVEEALASEDINDASALLRVITAGRELTIATRNEAQVLARQVEVGIENPAPWIRRLEPGQRRAVRKAVARVIETTKLLEEKLQSLTVIEDHYLRQLNERNQRLKGFEGRMPPDPWPPE